MRNDINSNKINRLLRVLCYIEMQMLFTFILIKTLLVFDCLLFVVRLYRPTSFYFVTKNK
jgi:hypothetical protein